MQTTESCQAALASLSLRPFTNEVMAVLGGKGPPYPQPAWQGIMPFGHWFEHWHVLQGVLAGLRFIWPAPAADTGMWRRQPQG